MNNIFCPYCHKKNDSSFARCKYCGELLVPEKYSGIQTTSQVATAVSPTELPDCDQVLNWLQEDSLAIFVIGSDKRFVFSGPDPILLGRGQDESIKNMCDFSELGALATGISRRHALIQKTAVGYTLQDLNSTNGTLLNNQPVEPGQKVSLNCQDIIIIAQIRLTACFHTTPKTIPTEMRLLKRNELAQDTRKLYPNFMSAYLVPYLQAIAELQQLVGLSRSEPLSEPRIHKIVEDQDSVLVNLDLEGDVQQIINHTLLPWREKHAEYIGWTETGEAEEALTEQLNFLTNQIIATFTPLDSIMPQTVQNVQAAVTTLITSPLEPDFSQEATE